MKIIVAVSVALFMATGGIGAQDATTTIELKHPVSVAISDDGKIYISDSYNNRIVRIDDLAGSNIQTDGSSGKEQGNFNNPNAVCVDPNNRTNVSDWYNNRIVRIDSLDGTSWTSYGSRGKGVAQFSGPVLYVSPTGNVRESSLLTLETRGWWRLMTWEERIGGRLAATVAILASSIRQRRFARTAEEGSTFQTTEITG